jgi:hypothetical protein
MGSDDSFNLFECSPENNQESVFIPIEKPLNLRYNPSKIFF